MDYQPYVGAFADSFKIALVEMAAIVPDLCTVRTNGYDTEVARSLFSIVVPFKYKSEEVQGEFILCMDDAEVAVDLSNHVASNLGLPRSEDFDESSKQILFEFWNTVVGLAITAWDSMGMNVVFGVPSIRNHEEGAAQGADLSGGNRYFLVAKHGIQKLVVMMVFNESVPVAESTLKNRSVLVVDDSKMVRMMLSGLLVGEGSVVHEACNGAEGVEAFTRLKPELTVMDLVMPELGGLDAISKIREHAPDARIIVLTSTAKREEIIRAAKMGVVGYLRKPLNRDKFLSMSRSCFAAVTV